MEEDMTWYYDEPGAERQAKLTAAYEANIAVGKPPYEGVRIESYGQLKWVFAQRHWSGEYLPPEGLTRADLRGAFLDSLDMSRMELQYANLSEANLTDANLSGANLDGAKLSGAGLHNANMSGASISWANLSEASLTYANLSEANLSGVNLSEANLSRAVLREANLSGANLTEADVSGADISMAKLSADTVLDKLTLSSSTTLGDVRWNGAALLRIDWGYVRRGSRLVLGDETAITVPILDGDKEPTLTRAQILGRIRNAARAYRGLGRELKDQNLTQEASWCRLSEQRLERRALFLQRRPSSFLAGIGSGLLDLVSGYGEIPARTFLSYLLVIATFAGLDYFISQIQATKLQHLTWDEALVLSLTSFHGRGFFPGALPLGDWAARLGAMEAIIGLFIELILIATFSRRFLGN